MAQKNISQVVSDLNVILAAEGDLLCEMEIEFEDAQQIKHVSVGEVQGVALKEAEGQPKKVLLMTNDGAES